MKEESSSMPKIIWVLLTIVLFFIPTVLLGLCSRVFGFWAFCLGLELDDDCLGFPVVKQSRRRACSSQVGKKKSTGVVRWLNWIERVQKRKNERAATAPIQGAASQHLLLYHQSTPLAYDLLSSSLLRLFINYTWKAVACVLLFLQLQSGNLLEFLPPPPINSYYPQKRTIFSPFSVKKVVDHFFLRSRATWTY